MEKPIFTLNKISPLGVIYDTICNDSCPICNESNYENCINCDTKISICKTINISSITFHKHCVKSTSVICEVCNFEVDLIENITKKKGIMLRENSIIHAKCKKNK